MEIRLSDKNKWCIEIKDKKGTFIPFHAIPPRQQGFDFIDRNAKYHFGYNNIISYGILIIIKDGKPTLETISHFTMRRPSYYKKNYGII